MGACLSSGMRHPMEKHAVWISYQPSEKGGKFHRPRGATINGAVPLRKAVKERKSRGVSEEDFAVTIHIELGDEIIEEREDVRRSLTEDSLTSVSDRDRMII